MKRIKSWNNLPNIINQKIIKFKPNEKFNFDSDKYFLAFGNGRSYGDVCINEFGTTIVTEELNKILNFDETIGVINCESGVKLNNILNLISDKGWFLPVVPGTSLITIGGAIANDIHGKNHHNAGTFGNFINNIKLLRSDGSIIECNLINNTELFKATIGGLGLTGIILSAEIKLKKIKNGYINTLTKQFTSYKEYVEINSELEKKYEYTVAWIDFFTNSNKLRGIYHAGNHSLENNYKKKSKPRKFKFSFPFELPYSLVNNFTLFFLNNFYFYINKNKKNVLENYNKFFFPLDAINNWNFAYGKKGFYQYQFVVPLSSAEEAMLEITKIINKFKQRPALGVIKTFGNIKSPGQLSFPKAGVTVAIDFVNKGSTTLDLLAKLDKIIFSYNGKLYNAKDSRMSKENFLKSNNEFENFKNFIDPKFTSSFIRRVT